MISVVLYGRNDAHGYNLHRRAALSINTLAEILTDDGDEILFTDVNSPDDYPTFIESIDDTLTPRARQLLRVFRVRPRHVAAMRPATHIQVRESVGRNVGIWRSNPGNRWVLSTNLDMIFVAVDAGRSLGAITADLDDALYHLPRFSLPEAVWESFDRNDPVGTRQAVRRLHAIGSLPRVVRNRAVGFDAPGDFQLFTREAIFAIDGFDERMINGWHVDSNITARLTRHYGKPLAELREHVVGYHCDHLRTPSIAHQSGRLENDWEIFIDQLADPALPEQRHTWGLQKEAIEQIDLVQPHRRRLTSWIAGDDAPRKQRDDEHDVASGALRYEIAQALPFLLSAFAEADRHEPIAWTGCRVDMLDAFATATAELGFTGPIVIDGRSAVGQLVHGRADRRVVVDETGATVSGCQAVVVEVGHLGAGEGGRLDVVDLEGLGMLKRSLRAIATSVRDTTRFVLVNSSANAFEPVVEGLLDCMAPNFASAVRTASPRHGVPTEQPDTMADVLRELTRRLDRPVPMHSGEAHKMLRLLHHVEEGATVGAIISPFDTELVAVSRFRDRGVFPVEAQPDVPQVIRLLEALEPAPIDPPAARATRGSAPVSACADIASWDDAGWLDHARGLVGLNGRGSFEQRNYRIWELIQVSYSFAACLVPDDVELVATNFRESDACLLGVAERFGQTTIEWDGQHGELTLPPVIDGLIPEQDRLQLARQGHLETTPTRYGAALLDVRGRTTTDEVKVQLVRLKRVLHRDAVVVVLGTVRMPRIHGVGSAAVEAAASATGFTVVGPVSLTPSLRTLQAFSSPAITSAPGMGTFDELGGQTSAVITLRLAEAAAPNPSGQPRDRGRHGKKR